MGLLEKVEAFLKVKFPPPDKVVLDDLDGVFGYVTSSRFEGMDRMDRINMIWDILDTVISKEERKEIFTIVPVTPEEEIVYSS